MTLSLPSARGAAPPASSAEHVVQDAEPRVTGCAIVSRLFDVGYVIDLDRAATLVEPGTASRLTPAGVVATALLIPNPPLIVSLGQVPLSGPLAGQSAELTARIYDFGAIALRARPQTPGTLIPWSDFAAHGAAVTGALTTADVFGPAIARLVDTIAPAIERPGISPVTEDYTVFRVAEIRAPDGRTLLPETLTDDRLAALLLQESRALSPGARRDLLPHRFSYYVEDLAVLAFEHALVIAPGLGETDVEWVLEFANAQLLELRFYDAALDAELPRMYDEIEGARHGVRRIVGFHFSPILKRLYRLIADTTEVVERVENALKVTDDVYLARVYSAALDLFRGKVWRAGIDRKLGIIRDTYGMLNGESQANRAELLELMIVLLIVGEIVMALL